MSSAKFRSFFFVLLPSFAVLFSCAVRDETPVPDPAERVAMDRAAGIVAGMSDGELAAQVLLTGVEGTTGLARRNVELFSRLPVGGAMLFKYNLGAGPDAAKSLASSIRGAVGGGVPPFVAVDHEGGPVHRFGSDATRIPAAAEFGRLRRERLRETVEGAAYRSGRELRALGVTLNLAPVAEVAAGSSSAFLGERAYGEDPEHVAAAASAFVEGMRRAGVACAVKHFPGNGAADPHKAAAALDVSPDELDTYLRPFALVLSRARPAAVMVSHVVVSAVDPERPATLSAAVVEDLLRKRLGFQGLAVSDDLRMGAIAAAGFSPERAAPLALAAGIDLVMTWPSDAERLRDAIVSAVASGALARERLREAAARVVAVKVRYGFLDSGDAGDAAAEENLEELRRDTEAYLEAAGLR